MDWVVNATSRPLYPRAYMVFQFLYMSMRSFSSFNFFPVLTFTFPPLAWLLNIISAQKRLCFCLLSYVGRSVVISGKNFTFFLGILKFDTGQTNTDRLFSIHSAVTTVKQSHYRPGVVWLWCFGFRMQASPHHTTTAKPQRNTNTHRTRAIQPMK